MKKLIISTLLAIASYTVYAGTPNDTIAVSQNEISKWCPIETENTKGVKTIKYYCVYKDQLLTTSKTVMEKVALCKKVGAKCALICIGKKKNGVFIPKRIVLN